VDFQSLKAGSAMALLFYHPHFWFLLCIKNLNSEFRTCDIVFQKGQIFSLGFALLIFYGFYDICNRNWSTLGCCFGKWSVLFMILAVNASLFGNWSFRHLNINKFLGFKIWKNNVLSVNYLSPPLISTKIKIEKMDCIFTANNVIILKLKNITSQIKEKSS